MSLLSVKDLKVYFHTRDGVVKAVDGISYDLKEHETLGIVGESGSGKSVSSYSLLGLIPQPPGRVESGTAHFEGGVDLLHCTREQLRSIRGKKISMIFQDPMTCLNPFLTVGYQLMEPLLVHENISKQQARERALIALGEVGIQDGESRLKQYPHQFSGGMRQRVMIAMALITRPKLLIADEPTTALDVTVQAQILELIKRLQRERGMGVIFITHDLGVIAGIANHILVMYAGRIAEEGSAQDIFYHSRHPYTRALMESIPSRHTHTAREGEELFTIPGLPPDLSKPHAGCPFSPRCSQVIDRCHKEKPPYFVASTMHRSACHRAEEVVNG